MKKNQYALIETFLPEWPALSMLEKMRLTYQCTPAVFLHLTKAPIHVRFAMACMQKLILTILPLACLSTSFSKIPLLKRQKMLLKLTCILPSLKLYTRLMRSLSLLCFMEKPLVQEKLNREKEHAIL